MRLKICDSHLTCKVSNKCLNVRERVEVVEWNKRWSPPFPCYPVNRQCPWKKTLIEKKGLPNKWMITVHEEKCPSCHSVNVKRNWTHLAAKNSQPGAKINTKFWLSWKCLNCIIKPFRNIWFTLSNKIMLCYLLNVYFKQNSMEKNIKTQQDLFFLS